MKRLVVAVVVLLAGSAPAFAHRLHVSPKVVGNQLRVEAYYEDDTPAQDAKVTVRQGDTVVAEGRTGETGVWAGPCPKPGTYTVRVESVGHAATESLTVPEPTAEPVVETPTADDRVERTRTPWGRLAVGLAIIGGLGVVWLFVRRTMGRPNPTA